MPGIILFYVGYGCDEWIGMVIIGESDFVEPPVELGKERSFHRRIDTVGKRDDRKATRIKRLIAHYGAERTGKLAMIKPQTGLPTSGSTRIAPQGSPLLTAHV